MPQTAKIINLQARREPLIADVDKGYTRTAHDIQESLARLSASGREHQVLHAIMRLTYGWNKSSDRIANSQIEEETGIAGNHVSGILKRLSERKIIHLGKGHCHSIAINKTVSDWQTEKPKSSKKSQNRECSKNPNSGLKNPETGYKKSPNRDTPKTIDILPKTLLPKTCTEIAISDAKPRAQKPQAFKDFYSAYPAHRKGGSDQTPWKKWKSEKLTTEDAENALSWLTKAAESDPSWATDANGQYVLGITKFIADRMWLTPIPVPRGVRALVTMSGNDTSWINDMEDML